MTIILIVLTMLFFTTSAYGQEIKPLYQLPEKDVTIYTESEVEKNVFLIGSDAGLYRVNSKNVVQPLWQEGRVDQLVSLKLPDSTGETKTCWMMRTSKGIFFTQDLETFEERDEGLPFLTIKKYINKKVTLEKQIQELKDLAVNPLNHNQIVTATKDKVYISQDAGLTWKSLGSMSKTTPGVKAVAVATLDNETVVFMSHPIFGFSYILADRPKAQWQDAEKGFEKMQSLSTVDEIADILPVVRTALNGTHYTEIYVSQTYIPRIYKFNWEEKNAELIFKGEDPVEVTEGLTTIDNVLLYTKLEGYGALDLDSLTSPGRPANAEDWNKAFAAVPGMINTAWVPQARSGFSKGLLLNELWLLYPGTVNTSYAEKATGQKSIYASAYQCSLDGGKKFKKIVKDRNMNSIVIDMKDDYGYLRYDTHDPLVMKKASTSNYAIKNLNQFIKNFKEDNIYLIARIVTFKDRSLSKYADGKYAVWDRNTNKQWLGIKGYENITDEEGKIIGKETTYYDEHWVDPYSEEVWEYNVAIAKELIARGFDEVQFDYIRFPTDGLNLRNATYRWQNKGMDKESALISFLSYARENIDAPIGIDIYGANGWYRSGTRTGQDAEMLAEYVDVIGPMFYPSHFEQNFLDYAPAADRTYRIYYYGSFRNTVLCRNRAIIRPWVQSFYLNVSYDRKYYDSDYIQKQFFGVRDSIDRGYMCWNNSGDYSTTPSDVGSFDKFTGTAPEADPKYRKPAIGTKMKPLYVDDSDLSILDSILNQYKEEQFTYAYTPFLQILK